ncbi:MAG: hypothetical protein K6U14_04540 [Firmicutes bacterium]|nr:hypothetical protein [Alicyclobacillaceae bacterium]MCL6496890.1 hypothetical protein [Bacillota bacterium]
MKDARTRDPLGTALDRHFDRMGLFWDRTWHPRRRARGSRGWMQWTLGAAAAAGMGWLAWAVVPHASHATSRTLSAAAKSPAESLPQSVRHLLVDVRAQNVEVRASWPVFASYPVAAPTGRNWLLAGRFFADGIPGDHLSVLVDDRSDVQSAVLLRQGQPVAQVLLPPAAWVAAPASSRAPAAPAVEPLATAVAAHPLSGVWVTGGVGRIESFTAAGPAVYLTRPGAWTSLSSGRAAFWDPLPDGKTGAAAIAALPAKPATALLTVETGAGTAGFYTQDGGRHWHRWSLAATSVTQVVAMGSRFWAVVDGSLATSSDGDHWQVVLPLADSAWAVRDYAINPEDPAQVAVSLTAVNGQGLGPLLLSDNGGQTWQVLPNYPALGKTPADMVMLPGGRIAALVNLKVPVVAEYDPQAQSWRVIPLPRGTAPGGRLAATPAGDLFYAPPAGPLWYYQAGAATWWPIPVPAAWGPPHLLVAVGDRQVMTAFATRWCIFVRTGTGA